MLRLGTIAALLLVLGLCFWVIHRLLRPVREIQAGVARMGSGELAHRIEIRRNDDLGQLTQSINSMASDIEQMLDAERQILLGISHELRTPITRAKVSVELLDESATRARLEDDLAEMESLVTALIESERLNTRHSALNVEPWRLQRCSNRLSRKVSRARSTSILQRTCRCSALMRRDCDC